MSPKGPDIPESPQIPPPFPSLRGGRKYCMFTLFWAGPLIPFIDLKEQYRRLRPQIEERIRRVLEHNQYILGPEIPELEAELARFAGVKHAVGCASGTDGLLMALMTLGVGPGDAVFTSPFTFIATAEVVVLLGATPVFSDVDPHTYNLDPARLEVAVQTTVSEGKLNPKAIIPVDLFGLPADYDALDRLGKRYGLKILEDAAQSFGARFKGRRTCSFGDQAVTSFFPAKPLGCYGDGGAVFTNDDRTAEELRSIRVHGQGKVSYQHPRLGINGRLDSIQAAVLLAKLTVFEEELAARNRIAREYTDRLSPYLVTPTMPEGSVSSWAQYSVLARSPEERTLLREKLKEEEIPTAVYYPVPLHLQPVFANLGYREGDFPVSERVSGRIFSLPMHPYLTSDTIRKVESVVAKEIKPLAG